MPGSAGVLCVVSVTFEAHLDTPYCPPWRPHMRTRTIAAIALLVTAACSDASITGPAQPSSGPRFDGGWTAGSGNRTAGGDSVGNTSTTSPLLTTCDERGGWTAGSGNREEPTPTCSEGGAQ